MIRKQTVLDAFEEAGFEYMVISERLFRIKIAERKYSFVEIVNDKIAFNSQYIGAVPELKERLNEIKDEIESNKPRKRRKRNAEQDDQDESVTEH